MAENKREHVALYVGARPFEVVAMAGEESVSRLYKFDLTCRMEVGETAPHRAPHPAGASPDPASLMDRLRRAPLPGAVLVLRPWPCDLRQRYGSGEP